MINAINSSLLSKEITNALTYQKNVQMIISGMDKSVLNVWLQDTMITIGDNVNAINP